MEIIETAPSPPKIFTPLLYFTEEPGGAVGPASEIVSVLC